MSTGKAQKTIKPAEKKRIYIADVPKPFVEYCIKKADTKEQKEELKKVLSAYSYTS